jgi:glycosyltransferase involved in cell wall biosynthesis
VVVEALRRLKDSGYPVTVIATGLMDDPRQPQHVEILMRQVRDYGIDRLFRPLGVVPYRDMLGLMRHAVAVINPSRFEGWSTSVEEARSMGKAIVLSAIPVHREQAPARGIFFETEDAEDAARAIREALSGFDPAADAASVSRAAAELPGRMRQFAESYQNIVLEAPHA